MRIIAGEFRGRRLKGPRGFDLRPTGDRLKETLFDILGASVRRAVVLDAFAGTGAIGLEALSRGAREAVFIESSREGIRLIRHNLALCGVTSRYRLIQDDIFKSLRFLGREGFIADISFLDPPYDWRPYDDLLDTLFRTGVAGPDSLVVIEHYHRATLAEAGRGYRRFRTVRQREKCLSFYRRPPERETGPDD